MTKPSTMIACTDQDLCLTSSKRAWGQDNDARSTDETSASSVPHTMLLNETLRNNVKKLRDIPLTPLNCTFGVVNEKVPVPFKSALRNEASMTRGKRADVSVVFLVRRPGCAACREHGQQLTELAMEDRSVAFWAVVKESGVEEQGILTFFSDFFHFPIYKDAQWLTYKAMGDRKLTPFKLIKQFLTSKGRWAKKGIPNRFKGGDVWVQGGILLFKRGKLRYAYEEEFGKELVVSDIRAAIKSLQEEVDDDMTCSTTASEYSVNFKSARTEI